jgi:L-lactate dehydrogenase complex protein LldG
MTVRGETAALWDLFAANAALLRADLVHAAEVEAAGRAIVDAAGTPTWVPPLDARFPVLAQRWPPAPCGAPPAPEVVTAGAFAIAETGSVAVTAPAAARAACLLAERLWLLVSASDIVPTLDAAVARVAALVRDGAPHVTFMSGPSRTADIERVLTIGVHGPRALVVVVVGGR